MGLILVPVPLGNAADMSFHAKEILSSAPLIIVEETKESSVWLRAHGISGRQLEKLNEHSTKEDLLRLKEFCSSQDVPLITDCGTPGFCDPGAGLVKLCRDAGISVRALPGPSSLMMILSLSSERLDQFLFRGFLPAESLAREQAWLELKKEKGAFILMDTPYRMEKTLAELQKHLPQRKVLLGQNLTQENELILEGTPAQVIAGVKDKKAEFMLLAYSEKTK